MRKIEYKGYFLSYIKTSSFIIGVRIYEKINDKFRFMVKQNSMKAAQEYIDKLQNEKEK